MSPNYHEGCCRVPGRSILGDAPARPDGPGEAWRGTPAQESLPRRQPSQSKYRSQPGRASSEEVERRAPASSHDCQPKRLSWAMRPPGRTGTDKSKPKKPSTGEQPRRASEGSTSHEPGLPTRARPWEARPREERAKGPRRASPGPHRILGDAPARPDGPGEAWRGTPAQESLPRRQPSQSKYRSQPGRASSEEVERRAPASSHDCQPKRLSWAMRPPGRTGTDKSKPKNARTGEQPGGPRREAPAMSQDQHKKLTNILTDNRKSSVGVLGRLFFPTRGRIQSAADMTRFATFILAPGFRTEQRMGNANPKQRHSVQAHPQTLRTVGKSSVLKIGGRCLKAPQ